MTLREAVEPRWRAALRRRGRTSPVVENALWLIVERIVRLALGLVVTAWMARYLGPEQFGRYNYAVAFVGLFSPLAVLGLHGVVVRDIVRDPAGEAATLGSTFAVRLLAGLATFVAAVGAVILVRPTDRVAQLLVAIVGMGSTLAAFETIALWFEAQVKSKYVVLARSLGFVLVSGLRVLLIVRQASLAAFAWAVVIENALVALGLLLVYRLNGQQILNWRASAGRARELLSQSWVLLLSGLASVVYLKIDQVMLGQMVGDSAVGQYAAAVRISEVWYFVPTALASSVFPGMLRAREESRPAYERRVGDLFRLTVGLALALSVGVTAARELMVRVLYGEAFIEAAPILAIHIWASVFVFMGAIFSKWLIAEDLLWFSLWRHTFGAVVNVLLNLALIPIYGGAGAAMATAVSYAGAHYAASFLNRKTRPAGRMMTAALLAPVEIVLSIRPRRHLKTTEGDKQQ